MTDIEIKEMCSKETLCSMQENVDDKRVDVKKISSKESVDMHEAVEQALSILSKAGVRAYLYADIKDLLSPSTIPYIYQFNTLLSLSEFDDEGNQTPESMKTLSIYNSFLWYSLFETITQQSNLAHKLGLNKLDRSDPKTIEIKMNYFTKFMWECLYNVSEYAQEHKNDA